MTGCVYCDMRARDPKTAASVMRNGFPYCSERCADLDTKVITECPSCHVYCFRDGACTSAVCESHNPGLMTCGECGLLYEMETAGNLVWDGKLKSCSCGADDWRTGDWFQTARGKMFWVLDPRAEDVDFRDISHSLSLICRFGGHCKFHYSVAQHSVLVSRIVKSNDPKIQLFGLLHDAAEAYVGDVISPIKRSLDTNFKEIEKKVLNVILAALTPKVLWPADPREIAKLVKAADMKALATEKRDVVVEGVGRWRATEQITPDVVEILPTSHIEAQAQFEHRFGELLSQVMRP